MAAALRVVRPGLLTTVQDLGRRGLQRLGVPVSGAADVEAMRAANAMAGNPGDEAVLEVTGHGPVLEAVGGRVRLAIAGGQGPWRTVTLPAGEAVDVGAVVGTLRCCVAVRGGLAVAAVLGGRSTLVGAGIGPVEGRPLRGGDLLAVRSGAAQDDPADRGAGMRVDGAGSVVAPPGWWAWPGVEAVLRAVPGPEDGWLTPAGRGALFGGRFVVSPRSDRVGVRLEGPPVERASAAIDSAGCAPGTVQLPPGGPPILLGPDRGTTGGYPRVATLASVDLPLLGRLRPGQAVRLEAVSVETAERLRREREGLLREWLMGVGRT